MSKPMTIDEIARELSRIAHHVDSQWGKLDKVLDAVESYEESEDASRNWSAISTDCDDAYAMLDNVSRKLRFLSAHLSK